MVLESVTLADCKRVETRDPNKQVNGYLVEMYKNGTQTVIYMSAALPGAFKGFHLHTRRVCNFIVLKGMIKVTMVEGTQKQEVILSGNIPQRLMIPTGIYISLENVGQEEAWLFNMPQPPYDPADVGEQVEKTPEEIAQQLSSGSGPA